METPTLLWYIQSVMLGLAHSDFQFSFCLQLRDIHVFFTPCARGLWRNWEVHFQFCYVPQYQSSLTLTAGRDPLLPMSSHSQLTTKYHVRPGPPLPHAPGPSGHWSFLTFSYHFCPGLWEASQPCAHSVHIITQGPPDQINQPSFKIPQELLEITLTDDTYQGSWPNIKFIKHAL